MRTLPLLALLALAARPHGPTAAFTVTPGSGPPPFSVDVNASTSITGHPPITSYGWDWGDGTAAGSGVTASHVYTATGTFTIRLTVRDQAGTGEATAEVVCISAGNQAPSAQIVSATPVSGTAPLTVDFVGRGTDAAPAGDLLEHRWDFGDGTPPAVFPGLAPGADSTPSHVFSSPGVYTCTLTVVDLEGIVARAIVKVLATAGGVPFAAFALSPPSGPPPLAVSVDAAASFDSDGTIVLFTWEWGDGTVTSGGSPVATHVYAATGTFTITLFVTDNLGLVASASQDAVCLSAGNVPPSAHIQAAVPAGGAAPLDVVFLGHGHDDAGPLELRWDFGDGSPVLVQPGVAPHANMTAGHRYTHAGNFTVTLRVADPENVTAVRTYGITVTDPVPANTRRACGSTGLEALAALLFLLARRRRALPGGPG